MTKSNTDNFLKNITIILMLVGFVSTFFIGANTILAQKVDRDIYDKDMVTNSKEHSEFRIIQSNQAKILTKVDTLIDIILDKKKGK